MAYSEDLRKKVLQKYQSLNEKVSYRKLAENFGVSYTFVRNLITRWKQTGSLKKKARGGGRAPIFGPMKRTWLKQVLQEKPDMTLKELSESYASQFFNPVSQAVLHETLKRMSYSRKKKSLRSGKTKD
jgi:transposase